MKTLEEFKIKTITERCNEKNGFVIEGWALTVEAITHVKHALQPSDPCR